MSARDWLSWVSCSRAPSAGRTFGNHKDLIRSIRERLWPLGDDVRFFPSHGPTSTFGAERHTNPYVGAHLFRRR